MESLKIAAATPAPVPARISSFAIDVPDALLRRARAGERAAFEQVYRRFERPVFTLALRICGDREEAADVLQDTMLKVIARIGDFRGDGSPFWGWLRQIAVNEALMHLRKGRRREDELPGDGHEPADEHTPPPPAAARCGAAAARAGGVAGQHPQRAVAVPRRGLHPRGDRAR